MHYKNVLIKQIICVRILYFIVYTINQECSVRLASQVVLINLKKYLRTKTIVFHFVYEFMNYIYKNIVYISDGQT